jgi:hypothetical protein
MNRMRNTITAVVFCLLTVLACPDLLVAAEPQDDEKITMPKDPSASSVPGRIAPPGKTAVVPPPPGTSPSDKTSPVEVPVVPVVPVQPDTTSPVEIPAVPAVPVLPQPPDRIVQIPDLQQETAPQKEKTVPPDATPTPESPAELEPGKQPSLMDFLLTTPLVPDKTPSEPMAEKDKQPSKALSGEPRKTPDKARPEEPKVQPLPKTAQAKPKPGVPLSIPPDAAKTGDLSFLEGCWRGNPPEFYSKRIITVRLCFDKNGNGKQLIDDPQAGQCVGATKGNFGAKGLLRFTSEKSPCTNGSAYSPTTITCEGEGNATVCFVGVIDAKQNFRIPFVRE